MRIKEKRKKIYKDDILLIKISKIYLFPIYIAALLLKFYDKFIIVVGDFFKYKILKRKKEDKIEDWWIS
ncbi:MAG: hypothetical protein SOY60_08335 [Fusobacterium gastrosuis]|uniref:hypothetical protein n=1 Tax=Fusobacterium TaxID=848 RepID=UPI001F4F783A|nr:MULTISPECIES: hypothetical protein [Fusobacterium]MDD7392566.1 hypothetical protein [Fusobacteriaceae bacterium]MCI5725074.1 hypothetical protein [Fusobacterium sp.]MCI7222796.1 hypothetical protein [Fusobacterium sp.]MDD7410422.1 hypothetical protein [Fusobacteriaceae bacterium]MDY4011660.1 hypothetical protein [Fusobacterium gastrosuis]